MSDNTEYKMSLYAPLFLEHNILPEVSILGQ